MKKSITIIILLAVFVAITVWVVVPYIRNEYVNACRSSIYTAMQDMKTGVLKYQNKNDGNLPASLNDLVPQFLDADILNPSPRYRWNSTQILVPMTPYGIKPVGSTFEITCQFQGYKYTQVVFNASSEEVYVR